MYLILYHMGVRKGKYSMRIFLTKYTYGMGIVPFSFVEMNKVV